MSLKIWNIPEIDKNRAEKIMEEYKIPAFLAMLLENRTKLFPEGLKEFLEPQDQIEDPFLIKDMQKAVERINKAIENFEKICIYGDYDADGITATSLLYLFLQGHGADVIYYIPERQEQGYGLNKEAIRELKSQNIDLIITVDNGISALEEAKFAKELEIDLIITDHHLPPAEFPQAVAILDPHRCDCGSKFKNLAGVGVVFKLIMAISSEEIDLEFLLETWSIYVLIGTIGDMMPLLKENRFLVKKGLEYLPNTEFVGIRALLEVCGLFGKNINAGNIAFNIAPRINATGRISKAEKAVQLLTMQEDSEAAANLALEIENENLLRKKIEKEILLEIEEELKQNPQKQLEKVLVVSGKDWHTGVIGIVAAKLLEKYGKPVIVISQKQGIARGSARSLEGFSIYEAIKTFAPKLLKFGGHPMAAGFDIKTEDIEEFSKTINNFANTQVMPFAGINLEMKLNPQSINCSLLDQIEFLEPFGKENPAPLFGLFKMHLKEICPVGGGKHLKLIFEKANKQIVAMRFFSTLENFCYKPGDILDLAVTLNRSNFNANEVSIFIEQIKFSNIDNKNYLEQQRLYEEILLTKNKEKNKAIVPDRQDFAEVYRFLKNVNSATIESFNLHYRLNSLKISFAKFLFILDIMNELGLISLFKNGQEFTFSVKNVKNKVEIQASQILKKISV